MDAKVVAVPTGYNKVEASCLCPQEWLDGQGGHYCKSCDERVPLTSVLLPRKRGRVYGGTTDRARGIEHSQRKYLPTLSDLVDRLTIVQLKSVFITEHTEAYVKERKDIEHDIDLILTELAADGKRITATEIHAIIVIMLSNRFIWENESKAREGGSEHDHLLKLTHSINGVRNTAKNQLANIDGGRRDYKTDCFAAELTEQFGNWNIFA